MEKFTASNGMVIRATPGIGATYVLKLESDKTVVYYLDGYSYAALREFFQHERDTELGRWRWPEDPGHVVYKIADGKFRVLKESTGYSGSITKLAAEEFSATWDGAAVLAYIAAHEPPRPWLDAKPGEVWLVTRGGFDDVVKVREKLRATLFEAVYDDGVAYSVCSPEISAGRRIWPETVSD